MNGKINPRDVVERAIQHVLSNSGRAGQLLKDEDLLFGKIGLDSLDLAQVVVALEQELKVDPFRKSGRPIRTFGDLVRAYQAELEMLS
jgi:acyl carrier protein